MTAYRAAQARPWSKERGEVKLEEAKATLLDKAAAYARSRLNGTQAAMAEAFLRRYWERVPAEDVVGRDPVDVYGAALAHLNLAEQRDPATPRVRVYTPLFDDHGWASTHTVVEIVTDDMPFLVDSVSMELSRQGCGLHLVVHPVVYVTRDGDGHLVEVGELAGSHDDGAGAIREAFLHVEIDRQPATAQLDDMRENLVRVLADVRAAVDDWPAMRGRAVALADELGARVSGGVPRDDRLPPADPDQVGEAAEFLRFLADDHFIFLGFREYDLDREGEERILRPVPGSGLGILREAQPAGRSQSFSRVPPELRQLSPAGPLILARASARATVHRAAPLDYVGVARYDETGAVVGERRFFGLYTTALHRAMAAAIPVIRPKVAAVLERAGYARASHDRSALVEVLEGYPRHELLEVSADELYEVAMGILALQERHRVRLFARRDRFGRFWSCLVYVPLDRYTQAVRQRMTDILLSAFDGTGYEYSAQVGESVLARLQFVVHTQPDARSAPDLELIEAQLAEATRSWTDDLSDAVLEVHGEEQGVTLARRYVDAFPAGYREDFPARVAVADIGRIEELAQAGDPDRIALVLSHPLEAPDGMLRFKLFQAGRPMPLSDVLPLLENMGVWVADQHPYEVTPAQGEPVWIHDFGLDPGEGALDTDAVKEIFSEAFAAIWSDQAGNDGFNRLVLAAGLTWREVAVLRAYSKYLRQVGSAFSPQYMELALAANPHVARLLVQLFQARFDPSRQPDPDDEATRITKELEAAIDAVASLDEDRILRSFLALVHATLRTNWFQRRSGQHRPEIAFKLDPSQVPDLPLPRPRFEIFVCSPRVEGVHLRGGRVARGGIRWSDRQEDFRTEILGLMKAQMVKNAVIVPVGAKGGFVVKRLPSAGSDREAMAAEVAACYRAFVSGLLDLTDNMVAGEVVHPPGVVAYDGDDPYLVVAADKGTATFSDLANSIAAEHGFWLGDAFASGGSSGYDHKKMGITARGAWESVKRHFRELGVDVSRTPFTAVGIGDMSGDVFGNGMLLSPHLRLVAAFDHRHIFFDPDPDPAVGFPERKRLFHLPRSSWADYDVAALSPGGGVFPRTAKSIPLSPEVRRALSVHAEALPPSEVVRAILRAPVDLLWNGGIGTYVKASTETHADAGDKANDPVRINASELRARVVGEGGNLGFTQRGRIEYALGDGLILTDAIDNSAGVDCSDHEVNIKVLLDSVVAEGELTLKQRDRLLVEMTDDVAAMVLRDNYDQTAALGNARAQAPRMVDVHARYLRRLESDGKLDRDIEFLPTDEALAQRRAAGMGLTAPEFAVLLAYTKNDVASRLLASDVPEDLWLSRQLTAYFPAPLRTGRFAEAMARHPLRREIIATQVTNWLIDRAGTSFVYRLTEETGAPAAELARAHAAAREIFGLDSLWAGIEALDNEVPVATQISLSLIVRRLAERASRWMVRHLAPPIDVAVAVATYGPGADMLDELLPGLLSVADGEAMEAVLRPWLAAGVPEELASRVAALDPLFPTLDIVEVAAAVDRPGGRVEIEEVAAVYFTLGERLEFDWLRGRIEALPRDDRWQTLARAALGDDAARERAALTAEVVAQADPAAGPAAAVDSWLEGNRAAVERFLLLVDDIRTGGPADLTTLSVAMREARALSASAARRTTDDLQ